MRSELVGNKVLLRPLTDADLPKRAVWTSDRELAALMGVDPDDEPCASLEEEISGNRDWLAGRARAGAFVYAIVAGDAYIGDIDITVISAERKAELTLFIGSRAHWGKGYGTETVRLVTRELFDGAAVERIDVHVAPGNERAYRFSRKAGFEDVVADARGTRFLQLRPTAALH